MQIHELNDFNGALGAGSYMAVDDGNDTGKISTAKLLYDTNQKIDQVEADLDARIDNIIAGGDAPSAAEVTDARLGADGKVYASLGDAIRAQVTYLQDDINIDRQTLTEHTIPGYLIYPSTQGFYVAPNGAVGRYEIENGVTYAFNKPTGFLLSNNGNIAQNKEVFSSAVSSFTNTGGYKYLFVNSIDESGVSYGRTVSTSKRSTVTIAGDYVEEIDFDSNPQDQLDKNASDIGYVTGIVDDAIFVNMPISILASNFCIVADSSNQYYGSVVANTGTDITDYIDISLYKTIKISVMGGISAVSTLGAVFYDSLKQPIEGIRYRNGTGNNDLLKLTVPAGAKYIRTTIRHDQSTYGPLLLYCSKDNITKSILTNGFTGQKVLVASYQASDSIKAIADYVCDGVNDEVEIQAALDSLAGSQEFREGTVYLSEGEFNIDDFPNGSAQDGYVAINVAKNTPKRKHIVGYGRFYNAATIINVTAAALAALGSNKGAVFGTTDFVYARGAVYENFKVFLADNQHKVTVIDNTGMASGICNDLSISAVPSNISNTENTPMPAVDCVGVTGYCGDDSGTYNEMNRIFVTGFYEGFRLGGEHLICNNLGARFNYYSYTFGNYDWFVGTQSHPITLINCCDEHSACLPKFVRCGNYNEASQLAKQEVNLIDFNMELARSANFGGGYVEPAEEVTPGAFCGEIKFTAYGGSNVSGYPNPVPATTNNPNVKFWDDGSGEYFTTRNMVHPLKGSTAERNFIPTFMQQYFDTDLNKMLVYTGTAWVDMNGNAV